MKNSLKVLFDCEFGSTSGYGHLSRCLAIAESCVDENIVFFFPYTSISDPKALEMVHESNVKAQFVQNIQADLVILDRYSPPKPRDIEDTFIVQLVDQTSVDFGADAYVCVSPCDNWVNHIPAPIKTFDLDPPLRSSLLVDLGLSDFNVSERILFLSGGSKQLELKKNVLAANESSLTPLNLDILCNSEELASLQQGFHTGLRLFQSNFRNVLNQYSHVISSCGVTTWELLALQKRVCFFPLVKNQDFQLEFLKKLGLKAHLTMNRERNFFLDWAPVVEVFLHEDFWEPVQINLDGAKRIWDFIWWAYGSK